MAAVSSHTKKRPPTGKSNFELTSSRPLSPEREAELIRYLAVEGFLVSLWPEMKERIEDETAWAFLGH